MTISGRIVTVELIHTPRSKFWRFDRRWQPWRWIARAENGKTLATSAECYANQHDCLKAINTVFGPDVTVRLLFANGLVWRLRPGDGDFEIEVGQ